MKDNKKWVISGVLFFAALIFLVYAMLEYRDKLPVLLGSAFCFLLITGIIINQLVILFKTYQKKQTMLLESRLAEFQNELTATNQETRKAAKINAYYTKKIGEALAGFEDELIDNQHAGNTLLRRIITTQVKATKVLVKYNQLNADKTVNSVHNQYQQITQSLGNSMNNTNIELRRIGENIMMLQNVPQPVTYQRESQITPDIPAQAEAPTPPEIPAQAEVSTPPTEEKPEPQDITETLFDTEDIPQELISNELLESVEVPPLTEEEANITPMLEEPSVTETPSAIDMPEDPNAQLSPEQIAALFASSNV